MDVKSKFQEVKEKNKHIRIDSEYKNDIFYGLDENGNLEMIIRYIGKKQKVESSNIIEVKIFTTENEKLEIHFILQNISYKSMFIKFCEDMSEYVESISAQSVISGTIKRWKIWKEMFGKKKKNLLDKKEIKGLIGELLVLRDFFFVHYTEDVAIQSWLGPLGGHKDFEVDDTWYEIKAIESSVNEIHINSLEQLDSDRNGHLVVVKLDSTSPASNGAINLNLIVMSLMNMISEPDNLSLFVERLDAKGYVYDEDYTGTAFFHKKTEYYTVNESFPKIVRSLVNPGIHTAEYTIVLNSIQNYKIKN